MLFEVSVLATTGAYRGPQTPIGPRWQNRPMASPIEDYAMLSDCHTAALISREGSIDWLCLPQYDSPSTFGALLGSEDHGRWMLRPRDPAATVRRAYDGEGFILV